MRFVPLVTRPAPSYNGYMEQHPVPQNVTTFQFRLIGDMTLKQFGYLCAGGVLAIISYKLPLPFFFTWPMATAFALLGVGFAFVPIEERPMDVWVFSFFKSIYSPTQYIWQKGHAPKVPPARVVPAQPAKVLTPQPQPAQKPTTTNLPSVAHIYAPSMVNAPASSVVSTHKPKTFIDQIINFFTLPAKTTTQAAPLRPSTMVPPIVKSVTGVRPPETVPVVLPTASVVTPINDHKIQELESAVSLLRAQLSNQNIASDRVLELQKQLTDLLKDKTRTDDELISLKRQINTESLDNAANPPVPSISKQPNSEPTVKPFNSIDAGVRAGIPRFTNIPNVITGIVQDDTGAFLPAILITVTNADGIPMRALKTNKLGQLAASTPLPNGVYVIEVEDPRERFIFDRIQVTLNGSVVPALEIKAKSQKQVSREKMAQDIFGKAPM